MAPASAAACLTLLPRIPNAFAFVRLAACVIVPLRRHIKDFALVAPVGHGSVSNVFYALCRKSCLRVAIKAYTKAKLTRLNARQVRLRGLEW